ncbi:MAG: HAD hydrolase family protein [Andreesenia angusta]|nr:HAD hydrolase family protein [Andreesenia angusta]
MKIIEIPGFRSIHIEHLVLDYNGTLAVDGKVIDGVRDRIKKLSKEIKVHILATDTFSVANSEFEDYDVEIKIMNSDDSAIHKRKTVETLGNQNTVCIGNGFNDIEMMKVAGLSLGIVQSEGMSGKLVFYSDIIYNNIIDALDALDNTNRIRSILRG